MRAGKNVLLEPGLIVLESRDDGAVRLRKLGLELLVAGLLKGCRNVRLEKTDDVGELFEGYLGVNARRVLEILMSRFECRRHLFFPGNQRTQTVVGRGEVTLHQHEGAI